MRNCPNCNAEVSTGVGDPSSSFPPLPDQPAPTIGEGALRFSHSGDRYLLGFATDHFGIWDRERPGGPVLRFPRTDRGWEEAWNRFTAWEPKCVEISQRAGKAPVPTMLYPVAVPRVAPPPGAVPVPANPVGWYPGPVPVPAFAAAPAYGAVHPQTYGPSGPAHGYPPYGHPAYGYPPPGGYRTARGKAKVASWFVGVVGALVFVELLLRIVQMGRFGAGYIQSVGGSSVDAVDGLTVAVGALAGLFMIASIVLWCVWQFRAQDNLRWLGAADLRIRPGWAVGWWFIPFANIVMPFRAVNELHRASAPDAGAIDWKAKRTALLLIGWWTAWLARYVPEGLVQTIVRGNAYLTQHQAMLRNWLLIGDNALTLIAAVFAVMIIRQIDRRQEQKAARMYGMPPSSQPVPAYAH